MLNTTWKLAGKKSWKAQKILWICVYLESNPAPYWSKIKMSWFSLCWSVKCSFDQEAFDDRGTRCTIFAKDTHGVGGTCICKHLNVLMSTIEILDQNLSTINLPGRTAPCKISRRQDRWNSEKFNIVQKHIYLSSFNNIIQFTSVN